MTWTWNRKAFHHELDSFYAASSAQADALRDRLKAELDTIDARSPGRSSYRRKAAIYELAAERCEAQVFRHCPFYYEISAGRPRQAWGFGGIGEWLRSHPEHADFFARCQAWKQPLVASGLLQAGGARLDIELDHHTIGYDQVLALGFGGLIEKCRQRLARTTEPKEREFLEAVELGYRALIVLAEKFATRAEILLAAESDADVRHRLEIVRATARHVPAEPPRTFYEALNTILFIRESIGTLEGIAVSTFGMLDRMLEPFYRADLAAGRLDRAGAANLLRAFLAINDVKFDAANFRSGPGFGDHAEASITVYIGGCDQAGRPVYNEVTELILEVFAELKQVTTRLNARISAGHPQAYFERLAAFAASGANVLSIFNDDVLIPAYLRRGKAVADCRLYVGGGCQENILQNCAVHSRATMWLNLCGVLNATLFPERSAALAAAGGPSLAAGGEAPDFSTCYKTFLGNLRTVAAHIAAARTANEADGWRVNPCPLHSATLDDCIERARDWTEGGTRYSDAALDCVGIGTLIDSLYALRTVVYERKLKTWTEFRSILANDYAGDENFRQYLLHRIPKYGQAGTEIGEFSAQVFRDVAAATSGFPNSRGGAYEASLFAFRHFVSFGQHTPATPDGRRGGQALSPGLSPSPLSLGEKCALGQILAALELLDLRDFPVVGMLDLTLPLALGAARMSSAPLEALIRRFLASGGSGLQFNVVSPAALRKARAEQQAEADLVVRVSGYSAYFTRLPEAVQDEILERTLVV